jgi:hypothetical protein
MATSSMSVLASTTASVLAVKRTPAQGALDSAGAGITGGMHNGSFMWMHQVKSSNIGYTGDSLSLQIIIAFLLGLSLYNAIELIVLVFVTFKQFRGLYFWSMLIAAFGIVPYSLGFIIKFFQLLDPSKDVGYVAVLFLTVGWWLMVTGRS